MNCKNCNKVFYSKKKELCRSCINVTKPICKNCGKTHTSVTKEYCRNCARSLGFISKQAIQNRIRRSIKNLCSDIKEFEGEIKRLAVKMKYDLISPIDLYRIVDIYLKVTCDENKYSIQSPLDQCRCMIEELILALSNIDRTPSTKNGRAVVHINNRGRIVAEWSSIRKAALSLDYVASAIRSRCNGKKVKSIKEDLRWKSDI